MKAIICLLTLLGASELFGAKVSFQRSLNELIKVHAERFPNGNPDLVYKGQQFPVVGYCANGDTIQRNVTISRKLYSLSLIAQYISDEAKKVKLVERKKIAIKEFSKKDSLTEKFNYQAQGFIEPMPKSFLNTIKKVQALNGTLSREDEEYWKNAYSYLHSLPFSEELPQQKRNRYSKQM